MSDAAEEPAATDVDVLQFTSLVTFQVIILAVYYVIFVIFRSMKPHLFLGNRPDSAISSSSNVVSWALNIARVGEEELYEAGGIDGVLHVRVAQMHLTISLLVTLTSLPVLFVYSFSSSATTGFSRVALSNVLSDNTLTWPIWITTFTVWINTLVALIVLDRFDRDVATFILRTVKRAPPLHHYALVATDLPPGVTRKGVVDFFGGIYSPEAVVGVHMIRPYSQLKDSKKKGDEASGGDSPRKVGDASSANSPPAKKGGFLCFGGEKPLPRGVRPIAAAYGAQLKALADADATVVTCKAKEADPKGNAEKKAAATAKAVANAEKALARAKALRTALQAALAKYPKTGDNGAGDEGAPINLSAPPPVLPAEDGRGGMVEVSVPQSAKSQTSTGEGHPATRAKSAVVVLDALARTSTAVTGALLCTGGDGVQPGEAWNVVPAPEPRDVLWPVLEGLPPAATRSQQATALRVIKTLVIVFYSFILAGLAIAVQAALAFVAMLPNQTIRDIVAVVSGIVPVVLASFLLNFMAVVYEMLAVNLGCVWSQSKASCAQQRDYGFFLRVVAFFVPMLASSLFTTLLQVGEDPLSLFPLLAAAVPNSAYSLMSFIFLKAVAALTGMTGVIPAAVAMIKTKFLAKTDFARAEVFRAPPKAESIRSSWLAFAQLVSLSYAPIAPVTAIVCTFFNFSEAAAARLEVGAVARSHYDSQGELAVIAAKQTSDNIALAAVIHFCVVALAGSAGSAWHIILIAPLPLPILYFRARMAYRHSKGLHGHCAGRLPLADASAVDAKRSRAQVARLHGALAMKTRAWAPPCADAPGAGPATEGVDGPEAGEKAQVEHNAWMRRYETPNVVAFEEGGLDEGEGAGAMAAADAA